MKPEAIVNVRATHTATCDGMSRIDLLAWVNDTLKANFAKVDELCTGAAYCQLMHSLFPNKISLKRVKFYTNLENDFFDNFKILQTTFQKLSVQKSIPIDKLCRGRFQDNIEFLQWFKKFYEANVQKDKNYDPIAERNGECIGYGLKVIKRNYGGRSKTSSSKEDARDTSRSLKPLIESNKPIVTFKRSLTKVQLKDRIKQNVEINEKTDEMKRIVHIDENKIDNPSDVLNEANVVYQNFEENQTEIELQEKLNHMTQELKVVTEKLSSAQRTRDKFYQKLKEIGYCIKEAEEEGSDYVETLKITNILLGNAWEDKKDKQETVNGENIAAAISTEKSEELEK